MLGTKCKKLGFVMLVILMILLFNHRLSYAQTDQAITGLRIGSPCLELYFLVKVRLDEKCDWEQKKSHVVQVTTEKLTIVLGDQNRPVEISNDADIDEFVKDFSSNNSHRVILLQLDSDSLPIQDSLAWRLIHRLNQGGVATYVVSPTTSAKAISPQLNSLLTSDSPLRSKTATEPGYKYAKPSRQASSDEKSGGKFDSTTDVFESLFVFMLDPLDPEHVRLGKAIQNRRDTSRFFSNHVRVVFIENATSWEDALKNKEYLGRDLVVSVPSKKVLKQDESIARALKATQARSIAFSDAANTEMTLFWISLVFEESAELWLEKTPRLNRVDQIRYLLEQSKKVSTVDAVHLFIASDALSKSLLQGMRNDDISSRISRFAQGLVVVIP